ncbi:MAG: hypothetical protein M3083_11880 [Actinomycetota bacterium]|nr:hypothetical protein [Actinomycetota bacterium]
MGGASRSDIDNSKVDTAVDAVVDRYGEHFVHFPAPIPARAVHLVLPDGSSVAAAHTGCACNDPDNTDYVVAGTYYFVVPADLTAATLKVDSYQGDGVEYIAASGVDRKISLAGFTIPLAIPAPPAPPAATPVTVLKLTQPSAAASGRAAAGSGSGGAALSPTYPLRDTGHPQTPSRPCHAPRWSRASRRPPQPQCGGQRGRFGLHR